MYNTIVKCNDGTIGDFSKKYMRNNGKKGSWGNTNMAPYQYMDSDYKDKTDSWPSYQYTGVLLPLHITTLHGRFIFMIRTSMSRKQAVY